MEALVSFLVRRLKQVIWGARMRMRMRMWRWRSPAVFGVSTLENWHSSLTNLELRPFTPWEKLSVWVKHIDCISLLLSPLGCMKLCIIFVRKLERGFVRWDFCRLQEHSLPRKHWYLTFCKENPAGKKDVFFLPRLFQWSTSKRSSVFWVPVKRSWRGTSLCTRSSWRGSETLKNFICFLTFIIQPSWLSSVEKWATLKGRSVPQVMSFR